MTSLADILGPEGAAADPAQVRSVASQLQSISDTAEAVRSRLSGLSGARWTGAAASAYRRTIGTTLPPELVKIRTSFADAADALRIYAGELDGPEGVITRAEQLVRQRDAAGTTADAAHRRLGAARDAQRSAQMAHAVATDPLSRAQAAAQLASADRTLAAAVADAQAADDQVALLQRQSHALSADLTSCASACARALASASEAGIRNSFGSWWERHIADGEIGVAAGVMVGEARSAVRAVGRFAERTGEVIAAEAKEEFAMARLVVDPTRKNAESIVHGLDDLMRAYSRWAAAAEPIVLAVGVVFVLAVCVLQPELAPVAVAATVEAEAAASKFLDATKLLSDEWLYARGETGGGIVVDDTFKLGLDLIPDGSGIDHGLEKLSSSLDSFAARPSLTAIRTVTHNIDELVVPDVKGMAHVTADKLAEDVERHLAPTTLKRVHALIGPVAQPQPMMLSGSPDPLLRNGWSSLRVQVLPGPVPAAA